MTPERWRRLEDLFHAAAALPEAERSAFLQSECPDDIELQKSVQRMLAQKGSSLLDSSFLTQTSAIPVGQQMGSYKLESKLGEGGMGEVFAALDTRLNRRVAIKLCRQKFSDRFQREALALSALNHPHICTLFDVGPDFLVMELVEGPTLATRIAEGPLPLDEVIRYGSEVADALAEAHAHGIVHRDLKPGNIMITRHGAKVLDFGLAKVLSQAGVTETNVVIGTPAYMAPEQYEGREIDQRTDLFALGLVLYEMSTGSLPFPGVSLGRLLLASQGDSLPQPSGKRREIPHELDEIVSRLLERDPARRYPSANQLSKDLKTVGSVPAAATPNRKLIAAVALFIGIVALAGMLFYRHMANRIWARDEAIPQIAALRSQKKDLAAFLLLRRAQEYLPADSQLAELQRGLVRSVSIHSVPPGAKVEMQDYLAPNSPWYTVGSTDLDSVAIPRGYFRWRVSKPQFATLIAAPETSQEMRFTLRPQQSAVDTVSVPAGSWGEMLDFIGWVGDQLPAFDADRFEVTNRQFQQFVDEGGYRKQEYWKEKFIKDGKELTWEQAMDLFRDPTGRPGPSTWEGGHFPAGQDEFPVAGVSWYEANAYAAFAGRSLPTLAQWFKLAPSTNAFYSINASNFNGRGPVKAGSLPDVGPYGTYDMVGNVREWCWNTVDNDRRFILGGAWGTQTYQAYDPEALPPFDRSAMNGFRTVRNHEPLAASVTAPLARQSRDLSKAKPVSDDVFQVLKTTYAYDKTPVDPTPPAQIDETADWIEQKLSIDAGYSKERLPVYVFLPKNVRPPFQTVVFFPSARVNTMPSSDHLGDLQFVDYVIQSGRAVIYPIFRETYQRAQRGQALPGTIGDLELVVQESKEVRRTLDYIETAPERFDKDRVAYLGVSQGAAYGAIFGALEDRFKTFILLDGGFFLNKALPARDQVNFVPRIKKPVLMINGKYDFTFSLDRAQNPMFEMLGTAPAEKRHVVLETPHDVSQDHADLSKEVLAWLDRWLGKIG